MADLKLKLGSFQFTDFELPESISIAGIQRIAPHELVGGSRVLDVLGASNEPLSWSGRFQGDGAQDRARELDELRLAGEKLELSFSTFAFDVIITKLTLEFERFYQILYTIECAVVENKAVREQVQYSYHTGGYTSSYAKVLGDDVAESCGAASQAVADAEEANWLSNVKTSAEGARDFIRGTVDTIQDKVDSVRDWANATTDEIRETLAPVLEARTMLQDSAEYAINFVQVSANEIDSFLPGNPVSQTLNLDKVRQDAYTDLYWLDTIDRHLGNGEASLRVLGGEPAGFARTNEGKLGRRVTVTNPNLFGLASRYYGSAEYWTVIAGANGVTSPTLEGVWTLVIPENVPSSSPGGVLRSPSGGITI